LDQAVRVAEAFDVAADDHLDHPGLMAEGGEIRGRFGGKMAHETAPVIATKS
jgi:hypothetical protein